jgi:hypothetical protein
MKEKIKEILETKFNPEVMTIEQLSVYYNLYEKINNVYEKVNNLYEKVNKKGDVK